MQGYEQKKPCTDRAAPAGVVYTKEGNEAAVVPHTFNSNSVEAETDESLSFRPAWSTGCPSMTARKILSRTKHTPFLKYR